AAAAGERLSCHDPSIRRPWRCPPGRPALLPDLARRKLARVGLVQGLQHAGRARILRNVDLLVALSCIACQPVQCGLIPCCYETGTERRDGPCSTWIRCANRSGTGRTPRSPPPFRG